MGNAPKKCNIRGAEIEDKVGSDAFVKCGRCEYQETKTEENQEQGFVLGEQLSNV